MGRALPYAKDINRLIASRIPTGKVLCQDPFDDPPVGWDSWGTGSIGINTTYKYMGKGCLGITTPAVANESQEAMKDLGIPANRRMGLEFFWAGQGQAQNFERVMFGLELRSNTLGLYRMFGISINRSRSPSAVRYSDVAGGLQSVMGFPTYYACDPFTSRVHWHHVKLVVDFHKLEYVRLTVDHITQSLAGLVPTDKGAPPTDDFIYAYLYGWNGGAATACLTLYDELVVTNEEP